MATQTVNNDPSAVKSVRITPSPNLSAVLPTLAIGEPVSFTVRKNPQNGKGQIALRGALIEADLPKHLKEGDKVSTMLQKAGDVISFKILGIDVPSIGTATKTNNIAQQLTASVRGTGTGLKPQLLMGLEENLTEIGIPKAEINKLITTLGNVDTLTNPKKMFSQLTKYTSGEMTDNLKQSVETLKTIVEKEVAKQAKNPIPSQNLLPSPGQALTIELRNEILATINQSAGRNFEGASTIDRIVERFTWELKENKEISVKEKSSLGKLLNSLDTLKQRPLEVRTALQNLAEQLHSQLPNSKDDLTKSKEAVPKLRETIVRLEQIIATQELLNQLNPVMQALGEPALVLFPFLFQGMLAHAEVTLEPDRPWNKKDLTEEEKNDSDKEPYQRIQMSIPLPAIGEIGIDIAHRKEEILVRLLAASPEIVSFISERAKTLKESLLEGGYKNAELTVALGTKNGASPAWSNSLSANTSVLA